MQFHLNGFNPGDPEVSKVAEGFTPSNDNEKLPDEVDVLIVGTGPAGLTLAAQLSVFPSIKTCIVERKDGPMQLGQADGVACRSMEMFNAFGFADRLLKEAYWVNETTFWKPDAEQPENISRTGRVQDVEDGLSEFPHVILNQARVHDFYLEFMRNSPTRLEPAYSRQLLGLDINKDDAGNDATASHPVTATFERVDGEHQGQIETIKARYVVGCDGARSVVRQSMGRTLQGDSANKAWGVMDVLAVTDFPDIRMKSIIQSANEGSILIIPREGGYLVRLYVEMDKLKPDERVSSRNITSDQLIAAAKRIFHPYSIDVKEVAWWSVYEIGQRLCDKFDDVPEEEVSQRLPHVFIAGDACHTHSPKAGQRMNVSMRDTFNLGWKLAAVLQGQCKPELLHTYTEERQKVAKMLIDFDTEWSGIMASRAKDGDAAISPEKFQEYFVKSGRYTAGTAIQYKPSMVSGELTHQQLATGFEVGMRLHSAPVIRLSDAKPVHLGHTIKADGRWRLFAFSGADNATGPSSKIHELCEFLTGSPDSPLRKYTSESADIDSVFDVRAVYQQGFRELDISDMPELLLPKKGRYGLVDYEKVFCADLKSGEDIFTMRGIDREQGCLVVVRPDQHVAQVLPLDGYAELAAFFDGVMIATPE